MSYYVSDFHFCQTQHIFIETFHTEKQNRPCLALISVNYLFIENQSAIPWFFLTQGVAADTDWFWIALHPWVALVWDWNRCPVTALTVLRGIVVVVMRKTSVFFWRLKDKIWPLIIAFTSYQWIAGEMLLYNTPGSAVYNVQAPRMSCSTSFKWICIYLVLYLWSGNTDLFIAAIKYLLNNCCS